MDETFFAIRRTDGETIGDFMWLATTGPDDWAHVEEDNHDWEPVEYEIVEMTVRPIAKRTFGPSDEVNGDET